MEIFRYKVQLMESILNLVARGGYQFWTSGTVAINKAEAFALKAADRYHTNRNEQQRRRARKRGEANTRLLACPRRDEKGLVVLDWWMLVDQRSESPESLVWQMEKDLKDVKKVRVLIGQDYELVQTPRAGQPPTWTWRMVEARVSRWRDDLRSAIRARDDMRLRQLIYSLVRVPGFHEIRRQAYGLQKLIREEWKRSRSSTETGPVIPAIGWVGRRRSAELMTLDELKAVARRAAKGARDGVEAELARRAAWSNMPKND